MENDFVLTKIQFAGLSRVLLQSYCENTINGNGFKEFKFVLTNFSMDTVASY